MKSLGKGRDVVRPEAYYSKGPRKAQGIKQKRYSVTIQRLLD
jgi:hypothetical protein